ncbi:TetR/AcrR family transcriptional regulator [Conexibacter stalactiti]|uniref:TetR/AcrR family transcriptional regulator n=1 Tax=Conexibacter stalactiti TaxID=1940611 RepID=A0ABU4HK42_9ACTN|nr:TetR/AcrR family transcriptional regulator [Conexibacter stalactiti]MDW5593062.1 TetR/AcrR family transcriptional regulator [Conexibacter stalactiti]MEC5033703.1 TetR/AcrR family transcriptional regulator [Conexibacter stalactiti]
MTPKPDPRRRYHHGDLRNALEAAALELVAERGPHGFTLAEASRRAGVSVAAPFRHFANREALLAALALRSFAEQERRFADAVSAAAEPVAQLAAFAAAYVQFAIDERALFDMTFGADIDKASYAELEQAGQRVLDVILAPALRLCPDPRAALELVYAVGAVAHGYAAFLREGVLGIDQEAGVRAMHGAARGAEALAEALADGDRPMKL